MMKIVSDGADVAYSGKTFQTRVDQQLWRSCCRLLKLESLEDGIEQACVLWFRGFIPRNSVLEGDVERRDRANSQFIIIRCSFATNLHV